MEEEKLKNQLRSKVISLINYICFIYFSTGAIIGMNSLKDIQYEGFIEWVAHMLIILMYAVSWLPTTIAKIVVKL